MLLVFWGGECFWYLEGRGSDIGNYFVVFIIGFSIKSVYNVNVKKFCFRVNLGVGFREIWGFYVEFVKWWVGVLRIVLFLVFLLWLWDRGFIFFLDGKF